MFITDGGMFLNWDDSSDLDLELISPSKMNQSTQDTATTSDPKKGGRGKENTPPLKTPQTNNLFAVPSPIKRQVTPIRAQRAGKKTTTPERRHSFTPSPIKSQRGVKEKVASSQRGAADPKPAESPSKSQRGEKEKGASSQRGEQDSETAKSPSKSQRGEKEKGASSHWGERDTETAESPSEPQRGGKEKETAKGPAIAQRGGKDSSPSESDTVSSASGRGIYKEYTYVSTNSILFSYRYFTPRNSYHFAPRSPPRQDQPQQQKKKPGLSLR